MKILVIGSGGREHALVWKLRESPRMEDIFCAPGSAGIAQEAQCFPVDLGSPGAILELAASLKADLTVIGPEGPLVAGVADEFDRAGRPIVGPSKAAARLEGSKIFAKQFMTRHGIATARFAAPENFEEAIRTLPSFAYPLVIKADGLAGGKGVAIVQDREQAESVLNAFMRGKVLGEAGERVVIEECLAGEELSFIVITDGRDILELVPTQDHKRLLDGDQGPNTGGMGAYSDDSILSRALRAEILTHIVRPTLHGLTAEGCSYRGFLYFGLMLTSEGPKLLEYNVRLGDPETQAILMRLRSDLVDILLGARGGNLGSLVAHWSPNPAVCVVATARGYPDSPELGEVISGSETAESMGGVKVFHAGTRVDDHRLVTSGGRVLGVTAVAEDLPNAIARAYVAMEKINFDGMHYRHDIGARHRVRETVPRAAGEAPLRFHQATPVVPKLP